MTEIAEKLKAELSQLASEDRAELAYYLIRSLDEKDEGDVRLAWETELERRFQEMESGSQSNDVLDELVKDDPESFREMLNDRC